MWEVVENAADNIQGKKQFAKFTMSQIKEVKHFSHIYTFVTPTFRTEVIILPDCSYSLCLSIYDLDTLRSRREEQSLQLFNVISGNHKLSHLLPPNHVNHYNLRRN